MENGVVIDTEGRLTTRWKSITIAGKCLPQWVRPRILEKRCPCIRYVDDIELCKEQASIRETLGKQYKISWGEAETYSQPEKRAVLSAYLVIRNFKFFGFALGRNGKGIYVRVHPKSWKKLKSRLKELSSVSNVSQSGQALRKSADA